MTEDERPNEGLDELPQPIVRRRRVSASWIWLVPALAAVVGASLVVRSALEAGPQITISFQSGEGLEAGKTPVKYKSVVIGIVHSLGLSPDRNSVLVKVNLHNSAESFATESTRFWVVRPRIGLGGVSGVDTLFSGAFIGADIGDSTESRKEFIGLESPPSVTHGTPGKSFQLHAGDLGSIDVGSPVYYRRIQVGHVTSYQLDADGKSVSLHVFIDAPSDRFVTQATRFWNASGVDVSLGANGLKLNTESLATVIAGGIGFQDIPGPQDDTPAPADASFVLFGDEATAMRPPDGEPTYIRMRFDQSVRGLSVDAPVEFLGIDIGHVVSVNLDYDEKTEHFPIIVGAVIYPRRLGRAQTKLAALAAKHGDGEDLAQTVGVLVAHGLRAQARNGNLLTGQQYIGLDFVPGAPKAAFDPAAKPLEIPTARGSLSQLQERLDSIVAKLQKVPFDKIGNHLDETLGQLSSTLKHVNTELLPELKGSLHGINKTLGSADKALGSADKAFSSDSPLQQNLGLTLEELQRMARSLRVFSDYLAAHPEALIRGRRADPAPRSPPPPAPPPPPPQGSGP
jgi:paraquat-inducible protein B